MSEGNVEVVLRALDLWNEGDLDGWTPLYDPGVVVIAPEGWPDGAVSEGLDAWRLQAQRLRDSWEEARVEVDEIRTVGEDRVLARIRYLTRGGDTDMSFDTPMAVVFSLEQRRITRAHYFWDVAQALEAAGLSE